MVQHNVKCWQRNFMLCTVIVVCLLTGDVRNDIYVTLMQGELRRGAGGKMADKNIEVAITVCNQDGEVIPVDIAVHCFWPWPGNIDHLECMLCLSGADLWLKNRRGLVSACVGVTTYLETWKRERIHQMSGESICCRLQAWGYFSAIVGLVYEWWGAGVVICLDRVADLHMAQLMPLPLSVSCFSKIQIGFTFTFLVPASVLLPSVL